MRVTRVVWYRFGHAKFNKRARIDWIRCVATTSPHTMEVTVTARICSGCLQRRCILFLLIYIVPCRKSVKLAVVNEAAIRIRGSNRNLLVLVRRHGFTWM